MKTVIGIDIGSTYAKGVIIRGEDRLGFDVRRSGGDFQETAETIQGSLLNQAGLSPHDIAFTLATGYGAQRVPFANETVTDISCHAKGIHAIDPTVRTGIDIGDQTTKAFHIDEKGNLRNFLLSGKCAGGSGRILQIIAKVLQLDVGDIGHLSLSSKTPVEFNTGCAVFAESEAISRISEGVSKEDLLAGLYRALASQAYGLAERLGVQPALALTGGGARNIGLVEAMRQISGGDIVVPKEPHLTAALGAARLAQERLFYLDKNGISA